MLPVCDEHRSGELAWPDLVGGCAACRIAYLEAQESLLEEWQQRAEKAEDAIAEIQRPLDAQMARLNETVTRLNGENKRRTEQLDAIADALGYPRESWRIAGCDVLAHAVETLQENYARVAGLSGDDRLDDMRRALELDRQAASLPSSTARFEPPTREEIAAYRDRFRAELDKRMDTSHPSASPSTEAHEVALRQFVEARNARVAPSATRGNEPSAIAALTEAERAIEAEVVVGSSAVRKTVVQQAIAVVRKIKNRLMDAAASTGNAVK